MIKSVIFDLGGVLYDIDYHRTINALASLGLADAEAHFSQMKQTHLFDLYETGKISTHTFFEELNRMLHQPIDYSELEKAWNAILIDFKPGILALLTTFKQKMPTFLLSNTNALHIETVNQQLKNEYACDSLKPFFHKVYYSFEVGMRKPDAEIFLHILKENNLKADEVLFIDDSPQHIESAQKLGLHTYHFHPHNDKVEKVLEKWGLLSKVN
jgi:putative hydrolase of the HAD superfamily